jgi:hypothetical protein
MTAAGAVAEDLPISWHSIAAFDRGSDGRWIGLTPESVHPISNHSAVFRVQLPGLSVIWKTATLLEAKVVGHIGHELSGILPLILTYPIPLPELGSDVVGLLMEDFPSKVSLDLADQLHAYGRACEKIASVHSHFEGPRSGFAKPKQLAPGLASAIPEIPLLLDLMASISGITLEPSLIAEITKIGRQFEHYHLCCASAGQRTLIHGDFHPANILYQAPAHVRIIDWAAAGTGPAEWDLVMCGEHQVSKYLASYGFVPKGFFQRLQAAVIVRMFQFIHAALGLAFGDSSQSFERFAGAIPFYARRLVDAANSTPFLGGDPVGRNNIKV